MKQNPIIIRSRLIPNGVCVNILGMLWARDNFRIDKIVVNHERIHTAQMLELLVIPFYIIYGIEWIVRLCQYHNCHLAYRNISFEREAYTNDYNLDYLTHRPLFNWIGYLKSKRAIPHKK